MDVEDFPEQLEEFAKDIKTFLKSLNEFPEFTDEAVNNSMNYFEADLKVSLPCAGIAGPFPDFSGFVVLGLLLENLRGYDIQSNTIVFSHMNTDQGSSGIPPCSDTCTTSVGRWEII